ncbi:MAG: nucleotidyltransferase domain-containing protein [Cyanobacteria bacterium P01_F01_bin.143]
MQTNKLDSRLKIRLAVSEKTLTQFCQKWNINEFALFGSVLNDRFHAGSDIDILISFQPNSRQGLLTLARIKQELEELFKRNVDIALKDAILTSENLIRRQEILQTAQIIYEQGSSVAY